MKVGDLVKNNFAPSDEGGWIGLVMEVEPTLTGEGIWVSYSKDPGSWRWYDLNETLYVEVINESR